MKQTNATIEIDEKTPLLMIAGPMFMELLLNILLHNVDTMMLSHYSENAVGAVGNANQTMFLIIILFNIIATATSVVVAQYLGAGKKDEMNQIYTLAMVVNLGVGILLSAGFVAFSPLMLKLTRVPQEMVGDCLTYIAIVGGCLFLQACYNVMLQILRCNGYTKVGMYVSIIINIINILGNYLFLYGPLKFLNLGVAGVAISTVVSRVIALVVALIFFFHKKIGKLSLRLLFPFPYRMLVQMFQIGLPSAGENLSYDFAQVILLSFINSMGNEAVNARTYCQSIISFAIIFTNACAMATQIITGHLVGAEKEEEAYKRVFKTLRLTLPVSIGVALVNWILSPLTLRLFTENQNIIRLGFSIMLVDVFIEIGRCLNLTFVNSLKAAGDYMYTLIVGLISMWGIGVVVSYLLGIGLGFGVAGVFAGTAADEIIRGLATMRRWYQKKWIGKAIVKKTT